MVQYSDGRIYAAAEDSCLTQLDLNLEIQKVLGQKIEKQIYALVATADYVAVGGENEKVTVYNKEGISVLVTSFQLISLLFQEYNHANSVYSISISGQALASGSEDRSCQVWDIRERRHLYTIKQSLGVDEVQLFSTGSSYDLISSGASRMQVWKGDKLFQTLQHSNYTTRFHFNSDKSMLAVGNWNGVTVWSTADWKKLADLEIGNIKDVNFNSASNKILATSYYGEVSIIDLE